MEYQNPAYKPEKWFLNVLVVVAVFLSLSLGIVYFAQVLSEPEYTDSPGCFQTVNEEI